MTIQIDTLLLFAVAWVLLSQRYRVTTPLLCPASGPAAAISTDVESFFVMTSYQFDLPVRSDQLEAIGMVASEWSYLESIVEAAIWNLAWIDEDTGQSITTHLGMPQRLDMLLTLFHLRHGERDEATRSKTRQLKKLCKKIRNDLSRKRGEAIHTRWVEGDKGSPMMYTVRARGELKRAKEGRSAAKIREVAGLVAAQSSALQTFLKEQGIFF